MCAFYPAHLSQRRGDGPTNDDSEHVVRRLTWLSSACRFDCVQGGAYCADISSGDASFGPVPRPLDLTSSETDAGQPFFPRPHSGSLGHTRRMHVRSEHYFRLPVISDQ